MHFSLVCGLSSDASCTSTPPTRLCILQTLLFVIDGTVQRLQTLPEYDCGLPYITWNIYCMPFAFENHACMLLLSFFFLSFTPSFFLCGLTLECQSILKVHSHPSQCKNSRCRHLLFIPAKDPPSPIKASLTDVHRTRACFWPQLLSCRVNK